MQSSATTPDQYFNSLPEDKREAMLKLRKVIKKNLDKGYKEVIAYGMVVYVIPHKIYAPGYHVDPKLPLMYLSIAAQKNFIAVYSMSMYGDPKMLKWFTDAYKKKCKTKLDMGKSCIRLKKMDDIPFDLIGELAGKMTVNEWIERYESVLKDHRKSK